MQNSQENVLSAQDKASIIERVIGKNTKELEAMIESSKKIAERQEWSNDIPMHDLAMARATSRLAYTYMLLLRDKKEKDFDAYEFMGLEKSVFKIAA